MAVDFEEDDIVPGEARGFKSISSSQPTHPGKDARALVVAQRGQAPERGQDRGCMSGHHNGTWPRFEMGAWTS